MSKWIRKGDQVLVIAGNDKGKTGEVLSRQQDRVLVQGVNIRKKHVRRTQQMQTTTILEIERPIHISNVALCDKEGKKLKLTLREGKGKERELVYSSGDKTVVYRTVKK